MHSRGKPEGHNWQTSGGAPGTIDDISVFVIPLAPYKKEWEAWKKINEELRHNKSTKLTSSSLAQTSYYNTDMNLPSMQPSTLESRPVVLGERTQTTSHQNGIVPINIPVEVLVPKADVLDISDLPIPDISLEAEEEIVPDISVSNSGNIDTPGDNTDPSSPNYCER